MTRRSLHCNEDAYNRLPGDAKEAIAEWLRSEGIDANRTRGIKLQWGGTAVVEYAVYDDEDRIMVTDGPDGPEIAVEHVTVTLTSPPPPEWPDK